MPSRARSAVLWLVAFLAVMQSCTDTAHALRMRSHFQHNTVQHKQHMTHHHNPLTLLVDVYHLHHDLDHPSDSLRNRKILQFGRLPSVNDSHDGFGLLFDAATIFSNSSFLVVEKDDARRAALEAAFAQYPRDEDHDELEGRSNVTFKKTFATADFTGADLIIVADPRYNATKILSRVDVSSPQLIVTLGKRLEAFNNYSVLATNVAPAGNMWYVHNVERAMWPGHEPDPEDEGISPAEGMPYKPLHVLKFPRSHAHRELRLPYFKAETNFTWTIEFHTRFCVGSNRVEGCCGAFVLPFVEGGAAVEAVIALDDFCSLHGAHFEIAQHRHRRRSNRHHLLRDVVLDRMPQPLAADPSVFYYHVPFDTQRFPGVEAHDDGTQDFDYHAIHFVLHELHDLPHHHRFTFSSPAKAPDALASAFAERGTYDLLPEPVGIFGTSFQFTSNGPDTCSVAVQRDGLIPPHHVLVEVGGHVAFNALVGVTTPFSEPIPLRPEFCDAIERQTQPFYMHATFTEEVPCFTYEAAISADDWHAEVQSHTVHPDARNTFVIPTVRKYFSRPEVDPEMMEPMEEACGVEEVPEIEATLVWNEHLEHFGVKIHSQLRDMHVRRFDITGVYDFVNGSQRLMFAHHCYSGVPSEEKETFPHSHDTINIRYPTHGFFEQCHLPSIAEAHIRTIENVEDDGIRFINITIAFSTTSKEDTKPEAHQSWLEDSGGFRHEALDRSISGLNMTMNPSRAGLAMIGAGTTLLSVPKKIIPDVDNIVAREPLLQKLLNDEHMQTFHGDHEQVVDVLYDIAKLSALMMSPLDNPYFGDNFIIPLLEIEEIWNRTDRLHLIRGLPFTNLNSQKNDNHAHIQAHRDHHHDREEEKHILEMDAVQAIADQQHTLLNNLHGALFSDAGMHKWHSHRLEGMPEFSTFVQELAVLLTPAQVLFPDFMLLKLRMDPTTYTEENQTHVNLVLARDVTDDGTLLTTGCRVPWHFMYFFRGERNMPDEMHPDLYPEDHDFEGDFSACWPSVLWNHQILAENDASAQRVVRASGGSREKAVEAMQQLLDEDHHSPRLHRHRVVKWVLDRIKSTN